MEPEQPGTVEQVRGLVSWIGAGRKLTQTGKVTLADARALAALLKTDDTIDPAIGDRTFKTKSSQELYHLNLLVEWAKAARLLRVTGGRLVPVKKNARVLEDPERLLDALFEALPRIGETVLPSGWLDSMLAEEYPAGLRAVLTGLYAVDLPVPEQKLRTATTAALDTVAKEGAHLDYTYDFGDSWDHRITVEHRMTAEAGRHYPACVDGAGACPPEDCGGPGGYEDLKRTLHDSHHPEHQDLLRWLGLESAADFDPAHFDLRETNQQLRTLGW